MGNAREVQGTKSAKGILAPLDREEIARRDEQLRQKFSRPAAIALASAALERGAQSPNSTGQNLQPCGLVELLEAVFDKEIHFCRKGFVPHVPDTSDGPSGNST